MSMIRPTARHSSKALTVNPLKVSPPLGAALAFLGIEGSVPLFHGSQGCTAFALVMLVRHFREAAPLQTTAMNELSTILGGTEQVEEAIDNIRARSKPKLIGICSTALTDTRGEDIGGALREMRQRRGDWHGLALVHAPASDTVGGLQEGWARAVSAIIDALVPEHIELRRSSRQINILPGSHLTPGDVDELKEICELFHLAPIVLPDLSLSLDGHVPEGHLSTSYGGTRLEQLPAMARSNVTIAIGEHMRGAAELLKQRTGVPYVLFDRLTGLSASDRLMATLSWASGRPVPERLKRRRSQLVDAMLDGHFAFGGQRVAIAAEPDLLLAWGGFLAEMGCEIVTAVTTGTTEMPEDLRLPQPVVGDLGDLERGAAGCSLLVANAHGAEVAQRLSIPLVRAGFPLYDRLGAAHRVSIGYRGTRDLIFEVGNLLSDHRQAHHGDSPQEPEGGQGGEQDRSYATHWEANHGGYAGSPAAAG